MKGRKHRAYRKKVDELAALLEGEDDKEEAFEAIRALIDQIVLSPEHGQLQVDLYGEITAILRLSASQREKRVVRRLSRQSNS